MKLEEGTTKRSIWKHPIVQLITLIVLVGGGAIIQTVLDHPPLDDPPFGLMLPDSVTDNCDEFEEDTLPDYPDNTQCQAYLIDDRLDSGVDFYLDSISNWGEPNYTITEEEGVIYHILIYDKGDQGRLGILISTSNKPERAAFLVIIARAGLSLKSINL